MTLHTDAGCSISSSGFTGNLVTSNCDVNAPNQATNAGCSIDAQSSQTYGAGFNAKGGGVYATEWTSNAVSIFFFPRGSIPSDISSGNPNPSGWGSPMASFAGSCNIDQHVLNQQIVSCTFLHLVQMQADMATGLRHNLLRRLGRCSMDNRCSVRASSVDMPGICPKQPLRFHERLLVC